MRSITLQTLNDANACESQCHLFKEHFGDDPAPLTKRTALKFASVFDWGWAADNLLSPSQRKAYAEATASAHNAYAEAKASARRAYAEATAPARRAGREARALAFVAAYKLPID
jgi:hypothetical protein